VIELWTKAKLDRIAGRASTSAIRIVDRFEEAVITPPESFDEAKAWGQYLDEEHRSDQQWGFYGTSAGIQTLATKQQAFGTDTDADRVRLIPLALKQLPSDATTGDERFAQKRQKGDFENIIKLAFIADALCPGIDDVTTADTPAIVHEIVHRAVNEQFWSSRARSDDARFMKERIFPTAYVLLVLQRYQAARSDPTYQKARVWLAERVVHDEGLDTPANNALIGLALLDQHETAGARQGVVAAALERCKTRLQAWATKQKIIVIDRPVFYGFSLGARNDYCFLHPEILASLLFLRLGNSRRTRSFVLRVMRCLTDNIIGAHGFIGQNGVMSSVDQMWAMRLISEFRAQHDGADGPRRLLPIFDQRLRLVDRRSRVFVVIALLLVGLGGIASTTSPLAGLGAWLLAIVVFAAQALMAPGKDD
jgi:hypothetical protein